MTSAFCEHGIDRGEPCAECEARRPMKVLCGNYPVCNDSSCRCDHEFSEPVKSIVSMPDPSDIPLHPGERPDAEPCAALLAGQSEHEAQAGECKCPEFDCTCGNQMRFTPAELAAMENRRKIKPASPFEPFRARAFDKNEALRQIWRDRSAL